MAVQSGWIPAKATRSLGQDVLIVDTAEEEWRSKVKRLTILENVCSRR